MQLWVGVFKTYNLLPSFHFLLNGYVDKTTSSLDCEHVASISESTDFCEGGTLDSSEERG